MKPWTMIITSIFLVQGQGQSVPANNEEFNISFRHSHTWTPASLRFPQPRTRGWAHCSFCHSTPVIPYYIHHSVLITNPICYEAHTFRNASSTSTGEPNNHHHSTYRRALQSDIQLIIPLIIIRINKNTIPIYPYMIKKQDPSSNWVPKISEATLLTSVMVEKPIIQVVISSVETFDGTKSKFESWIASVENAAQVSGQNILYIALWKMVGSPLTSAHRLRDQVPQLMWKDLKN